MDHPGRITVRTKPSFIRLIYSFALAPGEGGRAHRALAGAVLSRLKERASSHGWESRRVLDDHVLPHLAEHMNVDGDGAGNGEIGHWWRFAGTVPTRWVLQAGPSRWLELTLNGVDFVYFRTGIGMLLLEVDPVSDRLEDWQDVLHLARFYRLPDADGGVFARRSARITAANEPVVPGRPCGLGTLIHRLMTDLFGDGTWQQPSVPGLLAPFSAFFVDGLDADERLLFEAKYRWRRQLRSTSTVAAVDDQDLHAELRPYGQRMWLAYSSEGGGLFGADCPREHFFDHELPDHLRRPYTFGLLFALHQRLVLSRFSRRIARVVATSPEHWTAEDPSRDEIAVLQDDFLEYLTRCHFAQVFRTTNHNSNYKAWEETLGIPAFAEEVELQLRHLYERTVIADRIIDERRRTKQSGRVNAAVLGIALPTVVLAILAVAYPSGLGLGLTGALAAISAFLGTAAGWLTATSIPAPGLARGRAVRPPDPPKGFLGAEVE